MDFDEEEFHRDLQKHKRRDEMLMWLILLVIWIAIMALILAFTVNWGSLWR